MADILPPELAHELDNLDAQLDDLVAEVAFFCGCPSPVVRDRMCTVCKRPNLEAMVAWRADGCDCLEGPDNNRHGRPERSCRRCERPVFDVITQPQPRLFRRQ